jgi:TDG/mug DNA glycosylase family protein
VDEVTVSDAPAVDVPLALARAHREREVGAVVRLRLHRVDEAGARDLATGAGFRVESVECDELACRVRAVRERTLADTVDADMRLLVCGLNPSEYAADVSVGFARPGNRFWPAAIAAGLVSEDRDPDAALAAGVGMTDLVKRATARAHELRREEYRAGVERVERLVRWLQPGAVCFVGLAGWRAAVDAGASSGEVRSGFGGRPMWLMPSTSGANASSSLDDLVAHLRRALAIGERAIS